MLYENYHNCFNAFLSVLIGVLTAINLISNKELKSTIL